MSDEEFDELKWREVNRAELMGTAYGDDFPTTPPGVQPGDKVRLIVGDKTWIGSFPDGPWEEQA